MENEANTKRAREGDSDEFELDSPEVKRLRHDLLDFLDDSESDSQVQDLDSVMKSFAEEISTSPSPCTATAPDSVFMTSESVDSQPELGFLLEASDDELGLPPSAASPPGEDKAGEAGPGRVSNELSGIGELWGFGFGEEVPSYEFGDGIVDGIGDGIADGNGDYVALGGLFDYSDAGFGSSDLSWRSETLPAV